MDADDDEDDEDDDEEEVSQGHRSNSRTPPPTFHKSRDGVRLSVTSPPPAFANTSPASGALSPPQGATTSSVISPFGSPSGWISGQSSTETGQQTEVTGAAAVAGSVGDSKTSSVHINGDHVTQVRVDAIVLTPSTAERRNHRQQTEVVVDSSSSSSLAARRNDQDDDKDDDMAGKEVEEDRDQSELLVTTRLAVSNQPSVGGSSSNVGVVGRDQMHVTAVQVEHTSNAHQDPT